MTALALTARPGAPWASDPPVARRIGLGVAASAGSAAAALTAANVLARGSKAPEGTGRTLRASAAGLFASVLADSALEHYRGGFENPGMWTPLLVSLAGLSAGGGGSPRWAREGVYGLAALVGLAGVGFHAFNILRQPGGPSWQGLFYAAPIGAPAALCLGGAIGLAADRLHGARVARPRLLGRPAGKVLAGLSAIGLAGASGEAALLHFRGAFQNPVMWAPVSLPPIGAALMARAALETRSGRRHRFTRAWMGLTALLGLAGVGFHVFGVSRAMGGWRNWSQNMVDGPPLPAPPSFTAIALAAMAALALRETEDG